MKIFTAWKKIKAVSGSKLVIGPMLKQLQYQPMRSGAPLPDQFWTDPYFMGFFHNIVRYWSCLQLKREPTAEEFGEIFLRAIHGACGSAMNAKTATETMMDSLARVDEVGDLAHVNYGSILARAVTQSDGTKEGINATIKVLTPRLHRAEKARDFMRGAEDGLIYVNLVEETHAYDSDRRVQDAQKFYAAMGGSSKGVAAAHWQFTIKQEYKERYGQK